MCSKICSCPLNYDVFKLHGEDSHVKNGCCINNTQNLYLRLNLILAYAVGSFVDSVGIGRQVIQPYSTTVQR